jgi:tetratricopeptide (TPR) repeat protein
MVNTTLRAYLDELNLLLDQEALEEVIGHCRHILQHFPKNVETYRLLGRALLEKGRHDEAADVFQRVLSAVPDDFVSHLGLSSVAEEHGQMPTAIWHLERAYEQEPNNMALQGELKRLYETSGSPPERIQLTQGALIRIYAKGRLYEQANNELQNALVQFPDRIDLLLLQAQVLWNNERLVEAGEAALRVLEELPHSIEANRLLASLWLKSGRPSEAETFIALLEQLDPFLAWQTANSDGQEVPPDAFQLPRLDWDARAAAALATDVPDWVNAISNVFEAPESVSLAGGVNNWLEEAEPAPPSAPPAKDSGLLGRAAALKQNAPESTPAEIPDWLQDFASAAPESTPVPAAPWLTDVPDWFKEATPPVSDTESSTGSALPEGFEEAVSAPGEPSRTDSSPADQPGDQLPSGFTDLLMSTMKAGSVPQADVPPVPGDVPDWLADSQPTPPTPPASAEPLDAMAWLLTEPLPPPGEVAPAQAQPEPTADQGEVSIPPGAESEAVPAADLLDMDRLGATPDTESQGESAVPVAADLDWLSTMPGEEPPPEAEPAQASEPVEDTELNLDWLGAEASAEPPKAAAPAGEATDDLAWLSAAPGAEAPAAETAEAASDFDWLSAIPSETPAAAQPPDSAGTSPDWLSATPGAEAPAAETAEAASDFDWLSAIPSETPAAAQPPDSAGTSLDWLSAAPGAEAPAAETAEAASDLDWLSAIPSETPAAAQPPDSAGTSLDWLSAVPGAEAPAAGVAGQTGGELFELPGKDAEGVPDAWLSGAVDVGEESGIVAEVDPMAWLRSFTDESAESAPVATEETPAMEAEEAPVQGETPSWLSAMVIPPSPEQPGEAPVPPEELDFSGFELTGQPEPSDSLLSEAPAQPAADENWLSAVGSQAAEPATPSNLDWLSQPPQEPEEAPLELEDDWLASFEISPTSQQGASEPAPQAPETSGDWLATFEATSAESGEPEAKPAAPDDWLGSLTVDQPPSVEGETVGPMTDWLRSLTGQPETPATGVAEEVPEIAATPSSSDDWMAPLSVAEPAAIDESPGGIEEVSAAVAEDEHADWLTPEAQEHFDDLLKHATEKANEPRAVEDTGVLDPGTVPDWLSAFSDETAGTNLEQMGETGETSAGLSPDWLSPSLPTETLEATSPETEPPSFVPEGESPDLGAVPDWLSAVAPTGRAAAGPIPLDKLDFNALDTAGQPGQQPEETAASDMKDSGGVAQPANLMNTSVDAGVQAGQTPSPFAFERSPAWMRKKKPAANRPASSPRPDSLPDWLE